MDNPPPTPPRNNRAGSVGQRDVPFDPANLKDNAQWSVDRVFQAMDDNGDGSLSVSELHIGLTSVIGKDVTKAEAEKVSFASCTFVPSLLCLAPPLTPPRLASC